MTMMMLTGIMLAVFWFNVKDDAVTSTFVKVTNHSNNHSAITKETNLEEKTSEAAATTNITDIQP